jgi:SPP1 gp7 family putative phage head morphogenesis protein
MADATRRFKALKREITNAIVRDDIFGLRERPQVLTSPGYRAYAFETNPNKVAYFMNWLEMEQEAGVLQVVQGRTLSGVVAEQPWTNMYIDTSYRQGVRRGITELGRSGYPTAAADALGGSFLAPVHAETVAMMYQRTFTSLRGITEAMDAQISNELASGLINGDSPRQIARTINDRVDRIGITRARTLARTEVVRAHHLANINEYERAGVLGVGVKAEWKTAGYNVCARCKKMEKRGKRKPFTLKEIKPLIPLHPNCRCVAIPIPNPSPMGIN